MTTQTFIQMNEEDLNRVLQTMVNEKEESRTYDRYYSVLVPASWVAKIHSVTYQTVFNYIQRGMIKPVDRISGSEKLYVPSIGSFENGFCDVAKTN